jgi:uncharacterized membrane protein YphA (DoxX/SURF4 family)
MNIALWIAASVLAVLFFASGASKITLPRAGLVAKGYGWAEDFSPAQVKLIGAVEALGAIGLVLPPAVGIAEVLSPTAAAGLALFMLGAVIVHIRRKELNQLASPAVLAVLPGVLAVLRFGPYSF